MADTNNRIVQTKSDDLGSEITQAVVKLIELVGQSESQEIMAVGRCVSHGDAQWVVIAAEGHHVDEIIAAMHKMANQYGAVSTSSSYNKDGTPINKPENYDA